MVFLIAHSTTPVGCEGIGTDQQWDMIVFFWVFYHERNLDPWIERLTVGSFKVFFSLENDLICLSGYKLGFLSFGLMGACWGQKVETATICIRIPFGKRVEDVWTSIP